MKARKSQTRKEDAQARQKSEGQLRELRRQRDELQLKKEIAQLQQDIKTAEVPTVTEGKLSPEQTWARAAENQNAAGNLVLHLTGNVRQWLLSGIGGEPDHRIRDLEFSARGGENLAADLRLVVDRACQVVRTLPHHRLTERVTIQGHDVSVLQAIYHVVEHFSGHTAQIILLTKALTGEDPGFYSYLSKSDAHSRIP